MSPSGAPTNAAVESMELDNITDRAITFVDSSEILTLRTTLPIREATTFHKSIAIENDEYAEAVKPRRRLYRKCELSRKKDIDQGEELRKSKDVKREQRLAMKRRLLGLDKDSSLREQEQEESDGEAVGEDTGIRRRRRRPNDWGICDLPVGCDGMDTNQD